MSVSTIVIALAHMGHSRLVEPRLGKYTGDIPVEQVTRLSAREKKGLVWVLIVFIAWMAIFAAGLIPDNGLLRGPVYTVIHSPLLGFLQDCS